MNYHKLFEDILYLDEKHEYVNLVTGEKLPSVTSFIKKFSKPFDEEYWLNYKSKQLGVSKESLRQEWQMKGKVGRELGTIIHNYLEARFQRKVFKPTIPSYIDGDKVNRIIEVCERYYNDNKHLKVEALELVVGNDVIAGTLDKLVEGGLLRDFKTGSLKDGYDFMFSPFENLIDSSLNKYAIQLNVYRQLLEEKNIKINKMEIVFFTELGYEMYDIPFLNVPILIEDQVL
jgi:hypothetical protein